ncbi:LuxR C-terminal-related transcriptional regulator [Amycolatopsis sp. NBC_01488]|uniref:helix-turn-helix transcriptional regulator n=1 Tax=Amycolatopsis sp. NBC_01488 TaxID=2903563 RepID=UPI002E2BDB21|nr:AAA family ATPase [Amycolatopsis sp. NBC_01488]
MTSPSVLRGRSGPVAEALAVLRRTLRTGQGGVLVLSGEAGIGKTAIVSTVRREAATSGFRVAAVKGLTAERLSPGAAVLLALRFGPVPLLTPDELKYVSGLVDSPPVFLDQLASVLEERVGRTPLLVVIDDLQWVDHLSRTAVRVLPQRLAAHPVVWLLATRERAEAPAEGPPATVLDVGPLPDETLAEIGVDLLGEPPDERTRGLLGRVAGNPFYAVQVLEAVVRARERGEAAARIPAEFLSALRRRLAPLSETQLALLRLLSTLGRPATFGELTELSGESSAVVSAAVAGIVGAGLLAYEESTLAFRHDLVRESVYEELSPGTRRRLHERCAEFLLAEGAPLLVVAPHVRAAATPGAADAAELLVRAAELAAYSMPDSAAELAVAAFSLLGAKDRGWYQVGRRAVRVLANAQHSDEAVRVADLMLSRLGSPDEIAGIESEAARARWMTGRRRELIERMKSGFAGRLSVSSRARLLASSALAGAGEERGEKIRGWAEEARELAAETGDRTAAELAGHALGIIALNEGRHAESLARFRALRESAGDAYLLSEIIALQLLDRFEEAQRILTSIASAVETAALPTVAYGQMWQDFHLSRRDDAIVGARTVIAEARDFGNESMEADANLVLCSLALADGDPDGVRALLAEREQLKSADDRVLAENTVLLRGFLLAAEGRPGEAVELLRPKLRAALDGRAYWPWWPGWAPSLARVGLVAGDTWFASRAAEIAAEGAARNPGVATFKGLARHVDGLVTGDVAALRDAERILAKSPRPVVRAAIADDLGQALLRQGHREDGIVLLDRAWAGYTGAGHSAAADGVRGVLSRAGVRRREWTVRASRPDLGWDALTPAERKVARLIGTGMTNRAAAQELGISPNTVGTHVRSVFTKLDVRSRVQLSNVLHGQVSDGEA